MPETPELPEAHELLGQTATMLVSLASARLQQKDMARGGAAIEALRGLLPLLPEEDQRSLKEPLSQLQMLYVKEKGT